MSGPSWVAVPTDLITTLVARTKADSKSFAATSNCILVWCALASFANDGKCFPSVKRLAADTGLSYRTVRRCLQALESTGYLTRTKRTRNGEPDQPQTSNLYTLLDAPRSQATSPGCRQRQSKPGRPRPGNITRSSFEPDPLEGVRNTSFWKPVWDYMENVQRLRPPRGACDEYWLTYELAFDNHFGGMSCEAVMDLVMGYASVKEGCWWPDAAEIIKSNRIRA